MSACRHFFSHVTSPLFQYYPSSDMIQVLRRQCASQGEDARTLDDALGTAMRNARSHITKAIRDELLKHVDHEEHVDTKKPMVCFLDCLNSSLLL